MFSIIIPLYNKAPYIEKAIRSVAAQTFQEFELIIIDDGSKDEGFKIVEQLFDALTPPLGGWGATHQSNAGVSVARNNGVALAKYDYIAFLDADDWWEPTFLEEMKELIESFPEAGIFGSSYYSVKNGKYTQAKIGVEEDFQSGLINYFQVYAKTMWMPLWTGAAIIKKSVYNENNGFKLALKLGEDFDLWVRVAIKYPVAFLKKPLAYYNQDVDLGTRAVGVRLYESHEHMLFTDYGQFQENSDFRYLFEVLAVYGLLPYYVGGKNKKETMEILKKISWNNHSFKYRLYYRIIPVFIVKVWFNILRQLSILKKHILNFS